jgi:tetratricopeptide (TPR) repeat protein
MYLGQANRIDESIAEMNKAQQLDPLSPAVNALAITPILVARRYDDAIERGGRILETDPANGLATWFISEAYTRKGDISKAMDAQEKMAILFGQSKDAAARDSAPLRRAYANLGAKGYWQAALDRQKLNWKKSPGDPYDVAVLYARAGDKSNAFAWLEKAYQARSQNLTFWFRTDPAFDALRSDARYTQLIQRIGFPQ